MAGGHYETVNRRVLDAASEAWVIKPVRVWVADPKVKAPKPSTPPKIAQSAAVGARRIMYDSLKVYTGSILKNGPRSVYIDKTRSAPTTPKQNPAGNRLQENIDAAKATADYYRIKAKKAEWNAIVDGVTPKDKALPRRRGPISVDAGAQAPKPTLKSAAALEKAILEMHTAQRDSGGTNFDPELFRRAEEAYSIAVEKLRTDYEKILAKLDPLLVKKTDKKTGKDTWYYKDEKAFQKADKILSDPKFVALSKEIQRIYGGSGAAGSAATMQYITDQVANSQRDWLAKANADFAQSAHYQEYQRLIANGETDAAKEYNDRYLQPENLNRRMITATEIDKNGKQVQVQRQATVDEEIRLREQEDQRLWKEAWAQHVKQQGDILTANADHIARGDVQTVIGIDPQTQKPVSGYVTPDQKVILDLAMKMNVPLNGSGRPDIKDDQTAQPLVDAAMAQWEAANPKPELVTKGWDWEDERKKVLNRMWEAARGYKDAPVRWDTVPLLGPLGGAVINGMSTFIGGLGDAITMGATVRSGAPAELTASGDNFTVDQLPPFVASDIKAKATAQIEIWKKQPNYMLEHMSPNPAVTTPDLYWQWATEQEQQRLAREWVMDPKNDQYVSENGLTYGFIGRNTGRNTAEVARIQDKVKALYEATYGKLGQEQKFNLFGLQLQNLGGLASDPGKFAQAMFDHGSAPFSPDSWGANLFFQLALDPMNIVPMNIFKYPARLKFALGSFENGSVLSRLMRAPKVMLTVTEPEMRARDYLKKIFKMMGKDADPNVVARYLIDSLHNIKDAKEQISFMDKFFAKMGGELDKTSIQQLRALIEEDAMVRLSQAHVGDGFKTRLSYFEEAKKAEVEKAKAAKKAEAAKAKAIVKDMAAEEKKAESGATSARSGFADARAAEEASIKAEIAALDTPAAPPLEVHATPPLETVAQAPAIVHPVLDSSPGRIVNLETRVGADGKVFSVGRFKAKAAAKAAAFKKNFTAALGILANDPRLGEGPISTFSGMHRDAYGLFWAPQHVDYRLSATFKDARDIMYSHLDLVDRGAVNTLLKQQPMLSVFDAVKRLGLIDGLGEKGLAAYQAGVKSMNEFTAMRKEIDGLVALAKSSDEAVSVPAKIRLSELQKESRAIVIRAQNNAPLTYANGDVFGFLSGFHADKIDKSLTSGERDAVVAWRSEHPDATLLDAMTALGIDGPTVPTPSAIEIASRAGIDIMDDATMARVESNLAEIEIMRKRMIGVGGQISAILQKILNVTLDPSGRWPEDFSGRVIDFETILRADATGATAFDQWEKIVAEIDSMVYFPAPPTGLKPRFEEDVVGRIASYGAYGGIPEPGMARVGQDLVNIYGRTVNDFMGNIVANRSAMLDHYETLSLWGGPRGVTGKFETQSAYLAKIRDPLWRKSLTPRHLANFLTSMRPFGTSGSVALREMMQMQFELFWRLVLDGDHEKMAIAQKFFHEKFAEATDQAISAIDGPLSTRIRARAVHTFPNLDPLVATWMVLETRAGLDGSLAHSVVELAFRDSLEPNAFVHPELALATIPFGPFSRRLTHGFGVSGILERGIEARTPMVYRGLDGQGHTVFFREADNFPLAGENWNDIRAKNVLDGIAANATKVSEPSVVKSLPGVGVRDAVGNIVEDASGPAVRSRPQRRSIEVGNAHRVVNYLQTRYRDAWRAQPVYIRYQDAVLHEVVTSGSARAGAIVDAAFKKLEEAWGPNGTKRLPLVGNPEKAAELQRMIVAYDSMVRARSSWKKGLPYVSDKGRHFDFKDFASGHSGVANEMRDALWAQVSGENGAIVVLGENPELATLHFLMRVSDNTMYRTFNGRAPWVKHAMAYYGGMSAHSRESQETARQIIRTLFGDELDRYLMGYSDEVLGGTADTVRTREMAVIDGELKVRATPDEIAKAREGRRKIFQRDFASSVWAPEGGMPLSKIKSGVKVKHRSFGEGTISSVRRARKNTEITITFAGGEKKVIHLGEGTLQFAVADLGQRVAAAIKDWEAKSAAIGWFRPVRAGDLAHLSEEGRFWHAAGFVRPSSYYTDVVKAMEKDQRLMDYIAEIDGYWKDPNLDPFLVTDRKMNDAAYINSNLDNVFQSGFAARDELVALHLNAPAAWDHIEPIAKVAGLMRWYEKGGAKGKAQMLIELAKYTKSQRTALSHFIKVRNAERAYTSSIRAAVSRFLEAEQSNLLMADEEFSQSVINFLLDMQRAENPEERLIIEQLWQTHVVRDVQYPVSDAGRAVTSDRAAASATAGTVIIREFPLGHEFGARLMNSRLADFLNYGQFHGEIVGQAAEVLDHEAGALGDLVPFTMPGFVTKDGKTYLAADGEGFVVNSGPTVTRTSAPAKDLTPIKGGARKPIVMKDAVLTDTRPNTVVEMERGIAVAAMPPELKSSGPMTRPLAVQRKNWLDRTLATIRREINGEPITEEARIAHAEFKQAEAVVSHLQHPRPEFDYAVRRFLEERLHTLPGPAREQAMKWLDDLIDPQRRVLEVALTDDKHAILVDGGFVGQTPKQTQQALWAKTWAESWADMIEKRVRYNEIMGDSEVVLTHRFNAATAAVERARVGLSGLANASFLDKRVKTALASAPADLEDFLKGFSPDARAYIEAKVELAKVSELVNARKNRLVVLKEQERIFADASKVHSDWLDANPVPARKPVTDYGAVPASVDVPKTSHPGLFGKRTGWNRVEAEPKTVLDRVPATERSADGAAMGGKTAKKVDPLSPVPSKGKVTSSKDGFWTTVSHASGPRGDGIHLQIPVHQFEALGGLISEIDRVARAYGLRYSYARSIAALGRLRGKGIVVFLPTGAGDDLVREIAAEIGYRLDDLSLLPKGDIAPRSRSFAGTPISYRLSAGEFVAGGHDPLLDAVERIPGRSISDMPLNPAPVTTDITGLQASIRKPARVPVTPRFTASEILDSVTPEMVSDAHARAAAGDFIEPPRAPDPAIALKRDYWTGLLNQMHSLTEEQWLNRLEQQQRENIAQWRSLGINGRRTGNRAQIDLAFKTLRQIDQARIAMRVEKYGGSYLGAKAIKMRARKVLEAYSYRAEAVFHPNRIASWAPDSGAGAAAEFGRELWKLYKRRTAETSGLTEVLGMVDPEFVAHEVDLMKVLERAIDPGALARLGVPPGVARDLRLSDILSGLDEFKDLKGWQGWKDFESAMIQLAEKEIQKITGNKLHDFEWYTRNRVSTRDDFFDLPMWQKADSEISKRRQTVTDGAKRQTWTDSLFPKQDLKEVDLTAEPPPPTTRQIEYSFATAAAKARVFHEMKIDPFRYDEARVVLRRANQRYRYGTSFAKEAERVALAAGAAGSDEYKTAYEAEFLRLRGVQSTRESALQLHDWALRMDGADPESIISRFEEAYSPHDDIEMVPPKPLTPFQRRTLEEAMKQLMPGVNPLDDESVKIFLNTSGLMPPMKNRAALREYLVRLGYWSPRTAEDIATGKKSWSLKQQADMWRREWGVVPEWADPKAYAEGGNRYHLRFDQRLFYEQMRADGLFTDSFEVDLSAHPQDRGEIIVDMLNGNEQRHVKPVRDQEQIRRWFAETFEELAVDEAGNFTAFPWLMHEGEYRTYLTETAAKGLEIRADGLIRSLAELDAFKEVLKKVGDRHWEKRFASSAPTSWDDIFQYTIDVTSELVAHPTYMRRSKFGWLGVTIQQLAQLRRYLIFTHPAFGISNAMDSEVKYYLQKWNLRKFRDGAEMSATAKSLTLYDVGRDLPSTLWHKGKVDPHTMVTDAFKGGEHEAWVGLHRVSGRPAAALNALSGMAQLSLEVSARAEDHAFLRLVQENFDGAFEKIGKPLMDKGMSAEVAKSATLDWLGKEIKRAWPSRGNNPFERFLDMLMPFASYQFRNRMFFLSEAAAHPQFLHIWQELGDALEQYNLGEWKKTHPITQPMPMDRRRILNFTENFYFDISTVSDISRGLAPLYMLGDQLKPDAKPFNPVKFASLFLRVAGAGDQAILYSIFNTIGFAPHTEWVKIYDEKGFPTGKYRAVERGWMLPWDNQTEAELGDGFWPIELIKTIANHKGDWTSDDVLQFAAKVALFGSFRNFDKGAAINTFYMALHDKDPKAAKAWLETPGTEQDTLQAWWDSRREQSFPNQQAVIASSTPLTDNPWFRHTTEWQNNVKSAKAGLSAIYQAGNDRLWGMTPGSLEYSAEKKRIRAEILQYYATHPELYEDAMDNMAPGEWAAKVDGWARDMLVDNYYNLLDQRPKQNEFKSAVLWQEAVAKWKVQLGDYLRAFPAVADAVSQTRNSIESNWTAVEADWGLVLDRVGKRSIAIEAAKAAKDYDKLDLLYTLNEMDFNSLGNETLSYYFTADDYKRIDNADGTFKFNVLKNSSLLPRVKLLPDFTTFRWNRMTDAEKQDYADNQRYSSGMKALSVLAKAKNGKFDPAVWMAALKKDPWLKKKYLDLHPGKAEQWAFMDKYVQIIQKFGALKHAGKWQEAYRYFQSLDPAYQAQYYKNHGDRRQEMNNNLAYLNLMDKWNTYYAKNDFAGGAKFFAAMPKWARDRFYSAKPDAAAPSYGPPTPYSTAMGKWTDLLAKGDKEGAASYFAALPKEFKDKYYAGHPEAKLRSDIRRTGQLAEYFSLDDRGRISFLADNPEFGKWMAKNGSSDTQRRALILAGYSALGNDPWLKRIYREKYPDVFDKQVMADASLKKTWAYLAAHPEDVGPFNEWVQKIWDTYAINLQSMARAPRQVVMDHPPVHGKRSPHGMSAAWVRLHSIR